MKGKCLAAAFLAGVTVLAAQPATVRGTSMDGWVKQPDSGWYYIQNAKKVSGWQKIDGSWYYFSQKGIMQKGWQKLDGSWYLLSGTGAMRTGWSRWNNDWYYFSDSGVMQTSWRKVGGKWYFMDSSGKMKTGYIHDGKSWCYLDASGAWAPSYTGAEILPNGRKLTIENDKAYVDGILIVNKKYPLPPSHAPGGLTAETQAAFAEMKQAAAKDGINLYVVSGYRNYNYQVGLYHNYVKRDGKAAADRYSARPGHSEHQSGLCFDLNYAGDAFTGTPEAKWLEKNAHRYGFIVRFPKGKEKETGYQYESWHMRYIGKQAAAEVYESGLCLEEYLGVESYYLK